jgi:hypothetical protein
MKYKAQQISHARDIKYFERNASCTCYIDYCRYGEFIGQPCSHCGYRDESLLRMGGFDRLFGEPITDSWD